MASRKPTTASGAVPGRTASPSRARPSAAGTVVWVMTSVAVARVTDPCCIAVAYSRNAVAPASTRTTRAGSRSTSAGASPVGSSRAATATTPKPVPATSPSRAAPGAPWTRPAAAPATPTRTTAPNSVTRRPVPTAGAGSPDCADVASSASPPQTATTAPHCRPLSGVLSTSTDRTAVTATADASATCTRKSGSSCRATTWSTKPSRFNSTVPANGPSRSRRSSSRGSTPLPVRATRATAIPWRTAATPKTREAARAAVRDTITLPRVGGAPGSLLATDGGPCA